jgi:hypothetical protein
VSSEPEPNRVLRIELDSDGDAIDVLAAGIRPHLPAGSASNRGTGDVHYFEFPLRIPVPVFFDRIPVFFLGFFF